MVARVYMDANRVAISRPGWDVIFSPITPTTMAFDTSFTGMERPLLTGVLRNAIINNQPVVNFPTTYSDIPHVLLSRRKVGSNQLYESTGRLFAFAGVQWQAAYTIAVSTSWFQILRPAWALQNDPDWNVAFDWSYIVMAATPAV